MIVTTKVQEITSQLGETYRHWKETEKKKDELRTEFFKTANEALLDQPLATKVATVYGPTVGEAEKRAKEQFPAYNIKGVVTFGIEEQKGYFGVQLEENPEFKPFSYANPDDGFLYSKQITAGSVLLDEERFKEADPELYEAVTYSERKLRSLEELTPDQIAAIQEYVYEGKPKVRLAPPRKAKPEELEVE